MKTLELKQVDLSLITGYEAEISLNMKEYLSLKIDGIEDKEGFEKVHKAWQMVRDSRINVEKVRKSLVSDAVQLQRDVNDEAKRITELLKPIEIHLRSQQERINEEKEVIKTEKLRLEMEALNKRIALLLKNEMEFDGTFYRLGKLVTDNHSLKAMSEDKFSEFLNEVLILNEAEIKRKEEEERINAAKEAKEEEVRRLEAQRVARIAKEQETERLRLEAIQKKQDEKAKELQEAKDKIEREKELEQAKIDAVEKAKEDARIDAEFEIERQKVLAKNKRIEEERLEALKPDKEKLIVFAGLIETIQVPELTSKDGQLTIKFIKFDLDNLHKKILNKIEHM